jgi:hypothetical protein
MATVADYLGLPFVTVCNAMLINREPGIPPYSMRQVIVELSAALARALTSTKLVTLRFATAAAHCRV